jgi:hypothetical protein
MSGIAIHSGKQRKADSRQMSLAAAGEVNKLFERERAKNLVLYLYKLRDLVLSHRLYYIAFYSMGSL